MKLFFSFLIVLLLVTGCARHCPFKEGKWVDLTYEFSNETVYWPTSEQFKLDTVFSGVTKSGFYYSASKFCAAEHGGTHLDAPIHFANGGKTTEEITLDRLCGQAVVIDVSEKALKDKDYQINVEDITSWETKNGKIPNDAIILFHTGYGRFWPDAKKYLGTGERGQDAVAKLRFPGLDQVCARWLVENRKIKAVGIDTASIDYGLSDMFETHRILLGNDILVFENVASLDKLPRKGAYIVAFPIKIKGGTGGPLRIAALISN